MVHGMHMRAAERVQRATRAGSGADTRGQHTAHEDSTHEDSTHDASHDRTQATERARREHEQDGHRESRRLDAESST